MYTDTYDTMVGAMFGIVLIIIIVALIIGILMIISRWKILKKGGKNGWEALIPYYGDWVLCDMVGVCPYWILVMLAGTLLSGVPVVYAVFLIASLYYRIVLNVSLAKAFGKDTSYAVGLILLPVIFYPMLGMGKAQFVGANPMKDIIFGSINKNNGMNQQPMMNNNQPMMNNYQSMMNNNQPMMNNNQPMMNNNQPMMNNNQPMMNNNQPFNATMPVTNQQNAFCTNCGAPLTGDSAFCTNCGTKVN